MDATVSRNDLDRHPFVVRVMQYVALSAADLK